MINYPQGASWFGPPYLQEIRAAFDEIDRRLSEGVAIMPDDDWTIEHEANAPFFELRSVPSFDIEIRFKTRAVRHIMTAKEARAFANAILAAVRGVEYQRRNYEKQK